MLLSTVAVGIAQKVANDKKKKKKEARQGSLSVGDSDVARRAFNSQAQRSIHDAGLSRAGSEIKFKDSSSVDVAGQVERRSGLISPGVKPDETSAAPVLQPGAASPVDSKMALLTLSSPDARPAGRLDAGASVPSPYTEQSMGKLSPTSAMVSSPTYPLDSKTPLPSDTRSIHTSSTNSPQPHALRVKTKGADLASGFPYHPALSDVDVHPTMWKSFTDQVVEATKFGFKDHAQLWAGATAVAMTGAIVTSVFVGRGLNRQMQEKKVREGLEDRSGGGLADTFEQWNDTYFHKRGLYVHLELSESTNKHPEQKSKIFRKESGWYGKREDRERKRDERKFVLVVSKLNTYHEMRPGTTHELGSDGSNMITELPNSGDPKFTMAEAPGDSEHCAPVELPGDFLLPASVSLGFGSQHSASLGGFVELEGDGGRPSYQVKEGHESSGKLDDARRDPPPLDADPDSPEALSKKPSPG